jgi:phosphohistidine phosphatase SixA
MPNRTLRCSVACLSGLVLSFAISNAAAAQAVEPQLQGPELVDALRAGGLVILMRHMSTDDYVPADGSHVDDVCTTQRNLDSRGQADAKALGAAIATLGIPVSQVWSSPYCRCLDTGRLAFGNVSEKPELAVFDSLTGAEKDARAKQIRSMVNTAPEAGGNTVLITHTGTLLYTFGLQTRPEGIAHVFRPAEFGQAIYVGRLTPAQWSQLAAGQTAP